MVILKELVEVSGTGGFNSQLRAEYGYPDENHQTNYVKKKLKTQLLFKLI